MKGFELSRSSWHYKLYKWDDKWGEPENFCDYFWSIVRTMLKWTAIAMLMLALLLSLVMFVCKEPFVFLFLASFFTLFVSVNLKMEQMKRKRRNKVQVDKGPGFFKLKYKSFKGKYCPKIAWID